MDTNELSELAMFTALTSFFLPTVVSVIQQPRWSQPVRSLVAAAVSLVAGAGTVYFSTPSLFDDPSTMTTVMLTVLMASVASYRAFWKPLGIRKVEDATSPGDDTLAEEETLAQQVEAVLMAHDEHVVDPPVAGGHTHTVA